MPPMSGSPAAVAAAAAGWARSGESPCSIVVGRGVLTAHDSRDRFAAASPVDMQSHPNESFVFNRLRGATQNLPLNRFSRTLKPRTTAPPPLTHRSTVPPHAPEVGLPSSRSFGPSTTAKE